MSQALRQPYSQAYKLSAKIKRETASHGNTSVALESYARRANKVIDIYANRANTKAPAPYSERSFVACLALSGSPNWDENAT